MKIPLLSFKCLLIVSFLLAYSVMFLGIENASCAEEEYYSIHVASFKKLQNANRYVNSMKKKGKTVFWKEADVPEKGKYYRVYLGKYQNRDHAVEFWNVLNEEGAVSYFGVHRFVETAIPETEEDSDIIAVEEEEAAGPASDQSEIQMRFVDNGDGTVTDRKTKLMWVKNGWRIDFFSAVSWQDAIKKCEDFKYGGYSNWRLPSIKEWKSLMDKQNQYPALVEPNPFENIIVHMPYWSKTELNSSRIVSLSNPSRAYTVMLYYGRVSHQNTKKLAFVMPVRSLDDN